MVGARTRRRARPLARQAGVRHEDEEETAGARPRSGREKEEGREVEDD